MVTIPGAMEEMVDLVAAPEGPVVAFPITAEKVGVSSLVRAAEIASDIHGGRLLRRPVEIGTMGLSAWRHGA
ncbi:MAG: hypothetical protein GY906_14065 [bacterium]|nr:hypothetical protein [bacterium]